MAPQQTVTISGKKLKLTNLDKVLFPVSDTTKAEVIEYLQTVAPVMLPHVLGRPVTRKRWPDGVGTADEPNDAFFRKNLEDSAPRWVHRLALQHSDHVNTYPVATSEAELAWFGQVAALELHVPQWRFDGEPKQAGKKDPSPTERRNPDRLVLDLDPGPGTGLSECAQVARWCREILNAMGLPSVPVTSGSKGVHLYAALDGSYTSEQVSDVAKELATSLEKDHPNEVISSMKKSQRKGKVFIDWSQNHWNKTTVAPYSLRGRPGSSDGPYVAAPRTWEELEDPDLGHLDFRQVMERVAQGTDPLQDFGASVFQTDGAEDRLTTYRSMRDAGKTPEPVPTGSPAARSEDPIFVIQEHHARRLHFDTRLERDGVLVSWAVPKAPPLKQGTQRLAVQTEDHPLEYAEFEGTIPKGEYGGGEVTIWDSGTVDIEKWEESKVVFTLHGQPDGGLGGKPRRYALVKTGEEDKQWLIRLMKKQPEAKRSKTSRKTASPQDQPLQLPSPMLATLGSPSDIRGTGWTFEGKWDGYRMLAKVDADGVSLRSRNGKDLTAAFPELTELADLVPAGTILDGEVVALNSNSRPDFGLLQKRGRLTKKREIEQAAKKTPVHYMLFDVLHTAEQGDLTQEPYAERRRLLMDLVSEGQHVQAPGDLGDSLDEAMEVSEELKLEGILCKRTDSTYAAGRRSEDWVKIKHENHADVTIIGWRQGKGSRKNTFGSLLLALPDDDGALHYAGRVGTGFSDAALNDLRTQLEKLVRKTPPVNDVPDEDAADATWVTPKLQAEVVPRQVVGRISLVLNVGVVGSARP
ncbi:ATP-dependent DNA ligase, partial [Nesterenkonia lacusekhoensis]|uniref:ATP-dependent DNA ligase n=1 Tax=Nesterenkonia lacusekhoensis TaxID=150832 RepID=UPI003616DA2E